MAQDSSGLTVLLAESDVAGLSSVRATLERDGFEVVAEAHDAAEAIEAALLHRPTLCVLEAELPGDALGVANRIHSALPDTRIAMLAGSDAEEDALRAIRAGADGYLLKNTVPDRLGPALRAVARGESALPRAVTSHLVNDLRTKALRTRPAHGPVNRTLLYAPRFVRHLRRRIRSHMSFGAAWESARLRMRDYAETRIIQ